MATLILRKSSAALINSIRSEAVTPEMIVRIGCKRNEN